MSDEPQNPDAAQPGQIGGNQQPRLSVLAEVEDLQPTEQPVKVEMPDHRPVITYALMAITIFVFLLQQSGDALRAAGIWEGCRNFLVHPAYLNDLPACYGMKVNIYISELGEWWRCAASSPRGIRFYAVRSCAPTAARRLGCRNAGSVLRYVHILHSCASR